MGCYSWQKKQYESLLQAQTRPSVVDDATLNRVITSFTYQRNDLWSYDKQLARWKKKKLTPEQLNDVKSLADQLQKLQKMNTDILFLLNKLKLMVCVNANTSNDTDGGMSRNHDSESMSEV